MKAFDLSQAQIEEIVVHKVGNKTHEETLMLSNQAFVPPNELLLDVLSKYFLKPFKEEEFYHFYHETQLDFNEIYHFARNIFREPESFYLHSVEMAKKLFHCATHPKIKGGEFYVVKLDNCLLDGEEVDAIGLFKSENKDTFLTIHEDKAVVGVEMKEGININKLDKGCIIFRNSEEEGYKVLAVDNASRSSEVAHYWLEDFLQLKVLEDHNYQTRQYLQLCRSFCDDVFNDQNNVDITDQLRFLNKSYDFFKTNDEFDKTAFENEVIQQPEIAHAFDEYKEEYNKKNDLPPPQQGFQISDNAVKSSKKFFKSVLKLDKKFHVYVHGGENYIEEGYDDTRKMRFYKLFFHEEIS